MAYSSLADDKRIFALSLESNEGRVLNLNEENFRGSLFTSERHKREASQWMVIGVLLPAIFSEYLQIWPYRYKTKLLGMKNYDFLAHQLFVYLQLFVYFSSKLCYN